MATLSPKLSPPLACHCPWIFLIKDEFLWVKHSLGSVESIAHQNNSESFHKWLLLNPTWDPFSLPGCGLTNFTFWIPKVIPVCKQVRELDLSHLQGMSIYYLSWIPYAKLMCPGHSKFPINIFNWERNHQSIIFSYKTVSSNCFPMQQREYGQCECPGRQGENGHKKQKSESQSREHQRPTLPWTIILSRVSIAFLATITYNLKLKIKIQDWLFLSTRTISKYLLTHDTFSNIIVVDRLTPGTIVL